LPHRLRSLGVRRDVEVRTYGGIADHDLAHGLDAGSLRLSIKDFLGE
jgi:transketolase